MTYLQELAQRLGRFALPLVQGAAVPVTAPLTREVGQLLQRIAESGDDTRLVPGLAEDLDRTAVGVALAAARQQRLSALVPGAAAPQLGDDAGALLLLLALHELLFLHHPVAARLTYGQPAFLRNCALQLIARAPLAIVPTVPMLRPGARLPAVSPEPRQLARATQQVLGRHSLLEGLFQLWRSDTSVATPQGPREYRGMPVPVSRLQALLGRAPAPIVERRQVRVLPELLKNPRSAEVLRALLAASPLTALLPPVGCGLLPALAEQAAWLRVPVVARLVVARYLTSGAAAALAEIGSTVTALLQKSVSLRQGLLGPEPAQLLPASDVMTIFCLLGHLHVCVALSAALPPTADAAGPLRDSYALYAAVATRWPELAAPADVRGDARLGPRLTRYLQACRTAAGLAEVRTCDELCQAALAAPGAVSDVAASPSRAVASSS